MPAVPPGRDPEYSPASGTPFSPAVHYRYRLRDHAAVEPARVEVERFSGPALLVAGERDDLWPSAMMARAIFERRGNRAGDILLVYPEAGHLIGKAYVPAGSTLLAGGRLESGGTSSGNAAAQSDAWPRVVEFLLRARAR